MFARVLQTPRAFVLLFALALCAPIPLNRVHQTKVASTVRRLSAASILVHLELACSAKNEGATRAHPDIQITENEGERNFQRTCLCALPSAVY